MRLLKLKGFAGFADVWDVGFRTLGLIRRGFTAEEGLEVFGVGLYVLTRIQPDAPKTCLCRLPAFSAVPSTHVV